MEIKVDKSIIINELKKYLNINTDTKFAKFLGLKQNTISSWKSRNSLDYDLIISKCDQINANWLLTGEGEMLKSKVSNNNLEAKANFEKNLALTDIAFYDIQLSEEKLKNAIKRIELLEELVESYKLEIKTLKNELSKFTKGKTIRK